MKKQISLIAVVLLAALVSSCGTTRKSAYPYPALRSKVILFDNDVHCGIEGYARLAGLRDAMSDTADVCVVSSGDFLQGGTAGAISKGQYIVDIMKHVGYDAVGLGNHEFDYSVPRMEELLKQLGAPVVCVNFKDMAGNRPYAPYVICKMGMSRVAFVGVVTPTTLRTEAYSFYDESEKQLYQFCDDKVYDLVQEAVNSARMQGADYVVLLSHLGETPSAPDADSQQMIARTYGIDVVLDGHSHSVIPQMVVKNLLGESVPLAQTGTKFQNVGKLLIDVNGHLSTELIPLSAITQVNPEVQHATDSVLALSKNLTERKVCHSDFPIAISDPDGNREVRNKETNAGDLVADAYRVLTGADVAVSNGGGIRTDVEGGDLTYGQIVSLLPYDNYVCVISVTGAEIVNMLNRSTEALPAEDGDFPQVSGMTFTVRPNAEERIVDLMILDKESKQYVPVDMERKYQLATIDYCITGGGLRGVFKKAEVIKPGFMLYNDCLVKYATEVLGGTIPAEYAKPQGRITIEY